MKHSVEVLAAFCTTLLKAVPVGVRSRAVAIQGMMYVLPPLRMAAPVWKELVPSDESFAMLVYPSIVSCFFLLVMFNRPLRDMGRLRRVKRLFAV